MSPPAEDGSQTSDSKSSSGFASVFKNLTGSRPSKSTNPPSPVATAPPVNDEVSFQPATYGGPLNYEDLYAQLKQGNKLEDRIAAADALRHAVADYPLSGVASIFRRGKDLIEPNNTLEARVAGFQLLTACVERSTSTNPERLAYFKVLATRANPADFRLQLGSLLALTKNGRDLSGFPYDTIPLLTTWLRHTYLSTTAARKIASRQNRSSKGKSPLSEETNLALLFAFIVDIIKFSFNVFNEQTTNKLIDTILNICVHTPLSGDLKACITIIDTIITYGNIPDSKLPDCVKVLCSIHCLVEDVQPEAWRSISNLCRSHNSQNIVRILFEILWKPPPASANNKQNIREIRGALSVLEKLFALDGKDGYPLVPFTLLMAALEKVVAVEHTKVENDILRLVLSLFGSGVEDVKKNLIEEDWSLMFSVVTRCSLRLPWPSIDQPINTSRSHTGSPLAKDETAEQTLTSSLSDSLGILIRKVEQLLITYSKKSFLQREECIEFLINVHRQLPEGCSRMVIDHYMAHRYCYPTNSRWKEHSKMLLDAFFTDRTQPIHLRRLALKAVTDVFEVIEMMDVHEDPDAVQIFVTSILDDVGNEKDISILQEIIAFAVTVADNADDELFKYVIDAIRQSIVSDMLQSPLGSPPGSRQSLMTSKPASTLNPSNLTHTPSNVVTRGLVQIFMRNMNMSPLKASRAMSELLWVAKSHGCETDARISALKMLLRLRADWANRIFLTPFTESDGLAASLYRTPASLARKQATDEAIQQQRSSRIEDPGSTRISRSTLAAQGHPHARQPLRSASGVTRTLQKNHQMWMTPDPEALPEPASGRASWTMVSIIESEDENIPGVTEEERRILDVASDSENELPDGNRRKAKTGSGSKSHVAKGGQNTLEIEAHSEPNFTERQQSIPITNPDSKPELTQSGKSILMDEPGNEHEFTEGEDSIPKTESDDEHGLAEGEQNTPKPDSESKRARAKVPKQILDTGLYLETITGLIEHGCDWEVYSYILVHLPYQLTNQALFRGALPQIKSLRGVICEHIKNNSFQDPPVSSGLRKADVGICLFQILNMIMSYHRHFSKIEQDEIVRTFLQGVGERTSKCCIHALSICCHELPGSTSKALVHILQKMSQIITQSHVAIHILEFLANLARLPALYVNFREEEYRIVFAICFRYLQYVRDQQIKETSNRNSVTPVRTSGVSSGGTRSPADHSSAESNFQPNTSDELPQYVYALAYHVIIFWFLSLKLPDRAGQVSWITKNLISVDSNGKEKIDEQAEVTLDFMQRVAYADVDESDPDPAFTEENFGEIQKKRWVIGNSLITIEQATRGDWAQITKRQPSGTSCYIIQEKFSQPPEHQEQIQNDMMKDGRHSEENVKLPSHLLLQLTASLPQTGDAIRPIALPNDDFMDRAIKNFNRSFTVDGHKVGVIYIGENQTKEVEILANVSGSKDYMSLLKGMGTLTKLKGAKFNTQGLDRQFDSDGEYTFCWRDRVTEIVFHVTTQMPTNLDNDPQCIGKKRHIGNDFVNIIFNNSGLPFRFDTFPSEFNYVNIVITQESRASFVATRLRSQKQTDEAFYKVQVMSKPGFPEISPAAETKIMSLAALPGFVRLLALNASVFSLVWANREGGQHVSSWRNRLHEIKRIRDRYTPKAPGSTPASPPGTSNGIGSVRDSLSSLRRSSVANFLTNTAEPVSQRSSILSTAETEVASGEESLLESHDFSRWA